MDDEPPTKPADPERRIAIAHASPSARAAFTILLALDERLARIVAAAREPMIGLMRLVWWRDALAALDDGQPPGEPLLLAAGALAGEGVSGADLATMVAGWEVLLEEGQATPEAALEHARDRGGGFFLLAGRLLGCDDDRLRAAGEGWALADLARQSGSGARRAMLLELAGPRIDQAFVAKWPTPLRPLGMLATLAREDVVRGAGALRPTASRGRLLRMLAHRWTGR